jgi:membrane protein DedA with SNARE-associated domain
VLSAAGLGVPVSEDLTLLLAGALAARGVTSYWPTLAAGYFGVLIGDALIHQWGRRMGPRAYAAPLVQKALSPARQETLRVHFARRAFLTIVIGRHTPMLRAPIFFLSGASGVGFWKFVLADALSAAITVPAVLTLGFYFGNHLDVVRHHIHEAQLGFGVLVVCGLLVWLWRRRKRSLKEGP